MDIQWERVPSHETTSPARGIAPFEPMVLRARVVGGWLVVIEKVGVTFVPDADGVWAREPRGQNR